MSKKGKYIIELNISPEFRIYLNESFNWTRNLDEAKRYTTFNKAEKDLEYVDVPEDIIKQLPKGKSCLPLISRR